MLNQAEKFKAAFRRSEDYLHLNNAGMSPISVPARDAVLYWTERLFTDGDRCYPEAAKMIEDTRANLASLLQAKPSEVAFFPSCAAAISQVAFGIPLAPGDEILVWGQEYPSNFYPWRVAAERARAKLVVVTPEADLQTPVDRLLEKVTSKTKIIAVSWVQYRTGAMTDLEKLTAAAKSKRIFVCADVIQGAGVQTFDFQKSGVDAACGASHKWMCSPIGVGYLVLKEEHVPWLHPTSVGAMSFGTGEELASVTKEYRPGIDRFEPGAKNFIDIAALGASVQLIDQVGIATIQAEAFAVATKLRDGLLALEYKLNSALHGPIVNFAPTPKSPLKSIEDLVQRLIASRVAFANRPPGIRISPHAFTPHSDIDRVLKFLSN